jgi:hypothetical protein
MDGKGEYMKRRERRREKSNARSVSSRAAVVAGSLMIALLASGAILSAGGNQWFAAKSLSPIPQGNPLPPPGNPSKEYVHVGGRVVATEEPLSACIPPSPPSALLATATTSSSVHLTWNGSTGTVDHYVVERSNSGNSYSFVKNVIDSDPTVDTDDINLTPGTAYLYRVRAVGDAGGSCQSENSNVDMATTIIFSDEPLQAQITPFKVQHVLQLRQAVDAVRATANIGAASWTGSLVEVHAIHFSELRVKLNEALQLLTLPLIPIDPAIAQGNDIRAIHLQAVRDKVK